MGRDEHVAPKKTRSRKVRSRLWRTRSQVGKIPKEDSLCRFTLEQQFEPWRCTEPRIFLSSREHGGRSRLPSAMNTLETPHGFPVIFIPGATIQACLIVVSVGSPHWPGKLMPAAVAVL